MNNKEFLLGFVGGVITGGAIVWAYMYRVTKIALDKALDGSNNDVSEEQKTVAVESTPEPVEDPPTHEEETVLKFIPNDAKEKSSGPSDKEPYIITMDEADSEEVENYDHQILYYLIDDGVLMTSDGEEYTSVEDVGMDNLDILGPDCEDIMVRNDDNKTIYEVCVSMSMTPDYPYNVEDEE